MSDLFLARRLDVRALARAGASLSGEAPVADFERLRVEAVDAPDAYRVRWQARGEMRLDAGGLTQPWLHLEATTTLPLACQRCLETVEVALAVRRAFRFVATEEQAEAEDEEAEEDVLAWSRDFDLLGLVEDELLMELPLVPRHEVCPAEVRLTVQDADFEASQEARPKPFAGLAALKAGKPG